MLKKADLKDVKDIHKLVKVFADKDLMLPRSLNEISEHIRDYVVAKEQDEIVGCCALQIYIDELAEIKALAVKKEYQSKGIGREMVEYNLEQAKNLKVKRVFALTYEQEFFEKLGFRQIDRNKLPQKIWGECIRCPKFPDCDEIAMIKKIR